MCHFCCCRCCCCCRLDSLIVEKSSIQRLKKNVDAKERSHSYIRVPVHRGCHGRREELLPEQPPQVGRAQLARDQGAAVAHVQRLRHRAIRLATLLLVPDQRGHPVSARVLALATRDRALHAQEAHQGRLDPCQET